MALSNTKIRNAKPKAAPYKLSDEKGLFLLVQPSGGLLWRMKYRVNGRDLDGNPKRVEKKLSLGRYPDVSLKEARELRDEARRHLAKGRDPAEKKRRERVAAEIRAVNTFSAVANAYIEKNRCSGLAEATIAKREWFLRGVELRLGNQPIADITPAELLAAVRPFEQAQNYEKACRTLQFIGQVFRYAVANQIVASDPTRDLRGALIRPQPKHHAAILDPDGVGELLRALHGYSGQPLTRIALRLAPLVFVRPGELRQAEWSQVDLKASVWRIPACRMKMRSEHVEPLSRQSLELFRQAHELAGGGRYVFPSIRTGARPMSENTICAALRRLGYSGEEMTGHGFRSTASTLLNESGLWSPDAIERALSHKDRDLVRAAYHRGGHWNERVAMAQWWADYLDTLRQKDASALIAAAA